MIIWLYIYCCTLNTHKYHIFVYNRSSFPEIRRTGLSLQIDEHHYMQIGWHFCSHQTKSVQEWKLNVLTSTREYHSLTSLQ